MEKYIVKSAKTIEKALELACEEIGIDKDDAIYEVLKTPSKGFLGFGGTNAEVRVSYDDGTAEIIEKIENDIKAEKPLKNTTDKKIKKGIKKDKTKASDNKASDNHSIADVEEAKASYAKKELGITDEGIEKTKEYLEKLFELMKIGKVEIEISTEENNKLNINLSGDDMGVIIGRRGDTLDSIQYLTSFVINRYSKDYIKVNVDTENYRAKRRETLRKLALKVANRVLKYNKNVTLEPMTPYERRIIHATIQETPGVTTYSVGSEPRRKVVVTKEKDKQ